MEDLKSRRSDSSDADPANERRWLGRIGSAIYFVFLLCIFVICVDSWVRTHQLFDAIAGVIMLAALLSYLSFKVSALRHIRALPVGERMIPDIVSTIVALLFAQSWSERHEVRDAIGAVLMFAIACIGFTGNFSRTRKPSKTGPGD